MIRQFQKEFIALFDEKTEEEIGIFESDIKDSEKRQQIMVQKKKRGFWNSLVQQKKWTDFM